MKRKHLYLITILLIVSLSIIGCKKKNDDNQPNNDNNLDTSSKDDDKNDDNVKDDVKDDDKEKDLDKKEEDNTDNNEDNNEKNNKKEGPDEMRDITSVELVKEMKIGWNLGNTLDATGGTGTSSETSWGNPRTKKEMFDFIKEEGFNVIRIPTSWGKHLSEGPDYTIDEKWFERVQTIVDYAIDEKTFVILNIHHEDWHFPSYDNYDKASEQLKKVWTQIAERFSYYNEYLIFEGMNEPRMVNTEFEWNGGNEEGQDVVNKLNADFIETVRATGGNNAKRHLMVPTYAASSERRAFAKFEIPSDDKVIVSVHAYTPYNFALNKQGTSNWSIDKEEDKRDIENLFAAIDEYFLSKGKAVILGEFGAMNKDGNEADRAQWAEFYVKTATSVGVPCVWWDNGAFNGSGELFGILNRRELTWEYPQVVEGLLAGLK